MSQDQQSMTAGEDASAPSAPTTDETAAEKKPVRRRTTRVKKSDEVAVPADGGTAGEAAAQTAEGEAPAAPAPKRRGRPRKNAATASAAGTSAPAARDAADVAASDSTVAPAPAPKRRGRPRKTPEVAPASSEADSKAAAADGKAASSTSDAQVAADAPKPRRGRPRKVAASTPAEGNAASGVEVASPKGEESPVAALGAVTEAASGHTGTAAEPADSDSAPVAAPAPKRRGRPRKVDVAAKVESSSASASASASGTGSDEASDGGSAPAPEAPDHYASVSAGSAAASNEKSAESADSSRTPRERADRRAKDASRKSEREGREDGRDSDRANREASRGERDSRARNDRNSRDAHNDRSNRDRSNNKNGKNSDRNNRDSRNDRNDRRQRRQRDNRNNREVTPSVSKEELAALKVADLRAKAAELGVDGTGVRKAELVDLVYAAAVKAEGFVEVTGVLDILADGYGFLRASGYLPGEGDAYVSTSTIRRNGLRKGDMVTGQTRPVRDNEKFAAIQKVISVNGVPIEELGQRPKFSDLTPVFPDDRLLMEHGKNTITARVIDLAAPIGKGQRGLIVSPPKAGKTTVLKDIAASITANNPEVHLMYLGIDERPEEATDMERSIRGEVVSSTFDMPCENHIAVAELVIERAKRLVEMGRDVVILLDSITRLARAYNLAQPASGRILSGGVDSTALYPPKRFLGAARNIEGGGSLTILASALIDTGSKMDEVIFEEFKGTGNMELKLDRNLADRRIFPAIDPVTSGTRKEELLLDPQEAPLIWAVRRILANVNNTERAMDMLIKSLKQTDTNQEFLIRTAKKAQSSHGKSDENFEF